MTMDSVRQSVEFLSGTVVILAITSGLVASVYSIAPVFDFFS